MSIVINSLIPENPIVSSGNSITFEVSAFDTGGLSLSYVWQYSTDGNDYTSAGLTNNTSFNYTTNNLTASQNGLYFRVAISNGVTTIFSNEDSGIGNRIISVTDDPSIITDIDFENDFYPSTVTLSTNETFILRTSATLLDADISNTTLVSQINFQWQVSEDDGINWINITSAGILPVITEAIDLISTSPDAYYKYSSLQISNTTFELNNYRFRVIISFAGASNTPVIKQEVLLIVDAQIIIFRQPGEDDDTQESLCYKTSAPNNGKIKVEVGALTTANSTITYDWQVDLGNGDWRSIQDLISNYICFLKPGTDAISDILQLERTIFYNEIKIRCVVSGSVGEQSVISNTHIVYMEDVAVAPVITNTTIDIIEDRYGNILNRSSFTNDVIKNAILDVNLDVSRNTGINGDLSVIYERKDPDTNIWYEVGDTFAKDADTSIIQYTQFPSNTPNLFNYQYATPPLRRSEDNNAKYRLKITPSSIFTLNLGVKTLLPYSSAEITLNVYSTVYILNQPGNAAIYANSSTAFSVSGVASSGSNSDISYQWQYNISNSASGWINIANSATYNGVNTDILVINSTPLNTQYRYFRCVLSVPNQLSSVTTNSAELVILRDFFLEITSINDTYVLENENIVFSVTASSLSQSAITYQWEKSTNYNPTTRIGTWSNIIGANTNILTILSATSNDSGFYRLKLTSFGGEIQYTNIAQVGVTTRAINIIQNIPTSITVDEGISNAYTFSCEGISTLSTVVNYEWEVSKVNSPAFVNIGAGFNNSSSNNREYAPLAFNKIIDNLSKIRCKMTADLISNPVYTNECVVSVIRKFSYFADNFNKVVTDGELLIINLNPSWTGGTPQYSWEVSTNGGSSWTSLGETNSVLSIANINNSYNGYQYRCKITLEGCNQHVYTRNNIRYVISVGDVEYTLPVRLTVVSVSSEPSYYSLETQKTGAAIGTVICIPKPDGYVEDPSSGSDDIQFWKCSRSGTVVPSTVTTSSIRTSSNPNTEIGGNVWAPNKPSWADSSYLSPKWVLSEDRFKGYIEMRGQLLRASEFPELARMLGTTYGGTITGTYPSYNSNDVFRMPNLYAKRVMGTGNVDNNRGSISITPVFNPDGTSGGDKNIPGTIGGRYNYGKSAQLPPGSPGVAGELDGLAGVTNPFTYSIGTFKSSGFDEVTSFLQPTMSGSVTYNTQGAGPTFTRTPVHSHIAVSAGWIQSDPIVTTAQNCFGHNWPPLAGGIFNDTSPDSGTILPGPQLRNGVESGQTHSHGISDGSGTFDIIRDAGMSISDTNFTLLPSSRTVLDNSLQFFLRNNEDIPMNFPYFRLKYMIKAY
jgi:hypothetical protein